MVQECGQSADSFDRNNLSYRPIISATSRRDVGGFAHALFGAVVGSGVGSASSRYGNSAPDVRIGTTGQVVAVQATGTRGRAYCERSPSRVRNHVRLRNEADATDDQVQSREESRRHYPTDFAGSSSPLVAQRRMSRQDGELVERCVGKDVKSAA